MKRTVRIIERISEIGSGRASAWIIFGLMWLVLAEVFTRYVLGKAIGIADEVGGYVFVVITMLGLAYTWKEKGHTRIEFMVNLLSPKIRRRIRLGTLILAIVFIPILIWASTLAVTYSFVHETKSQTWLRAPLAWPQLFLVIGLTMLFLQVATELARAIKAALRGEGEK